MFNIILFFLMIQTGNIEPSMTTVQALAPYLTPITQEEVLYRDFGQSPVANSIKTFATTTTGLFVLGTIGSIGYNTIFHKNESFSFKENLKAGATIGLKYGTELAITELIENSFASYRGAERKYDKIIAGAVAGAAVNIPGGYKKMGRGAAEGAALASLLVLTQTASEALF